jgi:hypothetical protein
LSPPPTSRQKPKKGPGLLTGWHNAPALRAGRRSSALNAILAGQTAPQCPIAKPLGDPISHLIELPLPIIAIAAEELPLRYAVPGEVRDAKAQEPDWQMARGHA